MNDDSKSTGIGRLILSIGPALITASVVLGPGSILAASKVGQKDGYTMTWVLLLAVLLMIGLTALSSRLGVVLEKTPCEEIALRVGRPAAIVTGGALFLIAACFQFGNNLGVVAAIEPFLTVVELPDDFKLSEDKIKSYTEDQLKVVSDADLKAGMGVAKLPKEVKDLLDPKLVEQAEAAATTAVRIKAGVIVLINVIVIVALFGFRNLYKPVETMMKVMVGLMVLGFAVNLIFAQPDLGKAAAGLIPSTKLDGSSLIAVIGLFATTFSVGGAFYQAYLVREKGWTIKHAKQGIVDSTIGISALGALTMMIMLTAAAVLHGQEGVKLGSAADVARQLEPVFGVASRNLFCMGIFAGAFSSFLVNAMIGGTVLSDGIGHGGNMDRATPKICTVVALGMGMVVALSVLMVGLNPLNLIIFAQAVTTLGLPALAIALLYLATRPDLQGEKAIPGWMKIVAVAATLATLVVAYRVLTGFLANLAKVM